MPQDWRNIFAHTIWHSQHNRGNWFDVAYPAFNVVEALCWFGVALYVVRRAIKHNGSRFEFGYASLWFVFGLTDLREAYAQQIGLIAFKGLVLAALLLMRRRIIRRYPGARAV